MPDQLVQGVRLHYEESGEGAPIVCVHGAGGTALAWSDAAARLAPLGRVIAYDRRGCSRSERPEPYERTSVAEHGDDAAALIDLLDAAPAIVVGRSYGGTVAIDLALRHPDRVRALVLLEPDAPRALAPAAADWIDSLVERLHRVAERDGIEAVAQALVADVAGPDAWASFPPEVARAMAGNGPALLAELGGEWWFEADVAALAGIEQPALVVTARDSPPEFHQAPEAIAKALPSARLLSVEGGHLIDPAGPEVIAFVTEVLKDT